MGRGLPHGHRCVHSRDPRAAAPQGQHPPNQPVETLTDAFSLCVLLAALLADVRGGDYTRRIDYPQRLHACHYASVPATGVSVSLPGPVITQNVPAGSGTLRCTSAPVGGGQEAARRRSNANTRTRSPPTCGALMCAIVRGKYLRCGERIRLWLCWLRGGRQVNYGRALPGEIAGVGERVRRRALGAYGGGVGQ